MARHALKMGGFNWGFILTLSKVSYGYAVVNVAGMLGVSMSLVSGVFGVILGLGAVAAVTYVWNKRIWY